MRNLLCASVALSICVATTGCLKTRAQLKDDSDGPEGASAPVSSPAQPVQPQGQYVIDEIKAEITRLNGR